MSRDWLLYLDDLIDSAEKIERFLKGRSPETFAADEMLFDAVLFNLSLDTRIVWEAASVHAPKLLGHARTLRRRFDSAAGKH